MIAQQGIIVTISTKFRQNYYLCPRPSLGRWYELDRTDASGTCRKCVEAWRTRIVELLGSMFGFVSVIIRLTNIKIKFDYNVVFNFDLAKYT